MLKNIKKIIATIGGKYLLLTVLVMAIVLVSYNINAIGNNDKTIPTVAPADQPAPKLDANKTYSFTYQSKTGEGDYVTFTYTPNKGISWKGVVTLSNGCKFIQQNSLNYINYLVDPGIDAPVFSFNLTVGSRDEICTQALIKKPFSGELKEVGLSDYQVVNFKKYITVNWTVNKEPTPPIDPINFNKLKWTVANPEYIASGDYRFFLRTTYSRTVPAAGQCLSFVTFYGGSSCKTVEVRNYNKKNNVVANVKDIQMLRKYFGPVNTLGKAHFIADALRTQLFDAGEAKVNDRYFVRVNPECSADVVYYELISQPTTYELKLIKKDVGGLKGPIKCT
jgi:hypothetical protein